MLNLHTGSCVPLFFVCAVRNDSSKIQTGVTLFMLTIWWSWPCTFFTCKIYTQTLKKWRSRLIYLRHAQRTSPEKPTKTLVVCNRWMKSEIEIHTCISQVIYRCSPYAHECLLKKAPDMFVACGWWVKSKICVDNTYVLPSNVPRDQTFA